MTFEEWFEDRFGNKPDGETILSQVAREAWEAGYDEGYDEGVADSDPAVH